MAMIRSGGERTNLNTTYTTNQESLVVSIVRCTEVLFSVLKVLVGVLKVLSVFVSISEGLEGHCLSEPHSKVANYVPVMAY